MPELTAQDDPRSVGITETDDPIKPVASMNILEFMMEVMRGSGSPDDSAKRNKPHRKPRKTRIDATA